MKTAVHGTSDNEDMEHDMETRVDITQIQNFGLNLDIIETATSI